MTRPPTTRRVGGGMVGGWAGGGDGGDGGDGPLKRREPQQAIKKR